MTAAIRAELFKLRSTRMYYGLLGIGVGLTALIAAVLAGQAGSSSLLPSLATEVGQRDIVTNTGFALLTATVFGALVSSGEFRHRTVTDTYLDQPDRVRVMLAKIVAALAGGAVIGAAAAAVATVAGTLSAKGPVLLSAGDFVRYAAGSVLGAALLAAIGCVAGTLIRSQVGAVITVFVWCLAIEQILAGVSRSAARFLPLLGAITMAGGDDRAAMPPLPNGIHPLPLAAMAGLLAAVMLVLAGAAAHTVNRDIS
jgi:ABC-2 type transport system permease protein